MQSILKNVNSKGKVQSADNED